MDCFTRFLPDFDNLQKKNRRNLLCYSGLGGMWGSNPRLSEAVIRFRNLLNFSRLTNQFSIILGLFWDNFGTLFQPKIAPFFPRLSNCISGSYNSLVVTSFRTFLPTSSECSRHNSLAFVEGHFFLS